MNFLPARDLSLATYDICNNCELVPPWSSGKTSLVINPTVFWGFDIAEFN